MEAQSNTVLARADIMPAGQPAVSMSVARDMTVPAPGEPVDDTPYSFAFTGKHDSGALPPVNSANGYGHVLAAAAELKEAFELEMRRLIAAEAAADGEGGAAGGAGAGASSASSAKKPRLDTEGDDEGGGDEQDEGGDDAEVT